MDRWDFKARQRLSAAVSSLPPPCLNDVVHIIFGSTREIVVGDEFTVDFAKIGEGVCSLLEGYINTQRPNTRGSITHRDFPKSSPQLPPSPSTVAVWSTLRKQPQGDGDSVPPAAWVSPPARFTAKLRVCGLLPGRITISGSECSVIAAAGRFHLLLDETTLSVWWLDADTHSRVWLPAPVPASPSQGEDCVTANQCAMLLAWLRRLDVSEAFAQPVRDVLTCDAIYMDLGAIAQKLRAGGYATCGATGFAADVRSLHKNTAAFCAASRLGSDAVVYRMAQVLRTAFEHKWGQIIAEAGVHSRMDAAVRVRQTFMALPLSQGQKGATQADNAPTRMPTEPRNLIHHRVEVFWPRESMWYAALVTDYRESDGRHCVEYDNGHVEWRELTSSHHKYRSLGSSDAASSTPSSASSLISVQKLGIIVWAKSEAHPWWPAELCSEWKQSHLTPK